MKKEMRKRNWNSIAAKQKTDHQPTSNTRLQAEVQQVDTVQEGDARMFHKASLPGQ
ncbi:MAG: hypothetical protein JWR61_1172 [Ferruginibacter sp.]|nr:hypothetical protein [Ferruginibacter sp.]